MDGHNFVCNAIKSGARAALISQEPTKNMIECASENEACLLKVEDTYNAFERLASCWRNHLSGKVIGLTGSVGKTTTKNLIRECETGNGLVKGIGGKA